MAGALFGGDAPFRLLPCLLLLALCVSLCAAEDDDCPDYHARLDNAITNDSTCLNFAFDWHNLYLKVAFTFDIRCFMANLTFNWAQACGHNLINVNSTGDCHIILNPNVDVNAYNPKDGVITDVFYTQDPSSNLLKVPGLVRTPIHRFWYRHSTDDTRECNVYEEDKFAEYECEYDMVDKGWFHLRIHRASLAMTQKLAGTWGNVTVERQQTRVHIEGGAFELNVTDTLHVHDPFYLQQLGAVGTLHIHATAGGGSKYFAPRTLPGGAASAIAALVCDDGVEVNGVALVVPAGSAPPNTKTAALVDGVVRVGVAQQPTPWCALDADGGLAEFDCRDAAAGTNPLVGSTEGLTVSVACAHCLLANEATFGHRYKTLRFEAGADDIAFESAVNVTTLELWGEGRALSFERLTAGTLTFAGGVEQARVPFTLIRTFEGAVVAPEGYAYLFSTETPPAGLSSHSAMGFTYRVGTDAARIAHCTFTGGCSFAEADCGMMLSDLHKMTAAFPGATHAVTCGGSFRFGAIAYGDELTLEQTVPLIVVSLSVRGTLRGAFAVRSTLTVVSHTADPGHVLNITAEEGVAVTVVDEGGAAVAASGRAVYLFRGSVAGDVAGLRSAVCASGTTYWAYTTAPSVACACWLADGTTAGYEENWCGAEFALGVRGASLDIAAETFEIARPVVYEADAVAFTTTLPRATLTGARLNTPRALTVGARVVLDIREVVVSERLTVDAVAVATTFVASGLSATVAVGRLDADVTVGSGVSLTVGEVGAGSVTVAQAASVRNAGAGELRVVAGAGSAVTVGGAVVVEAAGRFTASAVSAVVRFATSAVVDLADFHATVVGAAGSTVRFSAGAGVGVIFRGESRGVAVSASKGGAEAAVAFSGDAACGAMLLNDGGFRCIACGAGEPFRDGCAETRCVGNCSAVSADCASCYECAEGFYSVYDECLACGASTRRCVSEEEPLLCADNCTLGAGGCVAAGPGARLVTGNRVVRCDDGSFPGAAGCSSCVDGCVGCTNASACDVCGGAVNAGGQCVPQANAAVQVNGGVVACDDGFVLRGGVCVGCGAAYPGCAVCTATGCVQCGAGSVLLDGSCGSVAGCAKTDGLSCTACAAGMTRKSPTECVDAASDTCNVYADGVCVQCKSGLVLLPNGSCTTLNDCTTFGDGVCLRCADGLFADETGGCRCLPHNETHPQRATRRARRVRSASRSARRATRRRGCT